MLAVVGVGACSNLNEQSKRTHGVTETDEAPQRAHADYLDGEPGNGKSESLSATGFQGFAPDSAEAIRSGYD